MSMSSIRRGATRPRGSRWGPTTTWLVHLAGTSKIGVMDPTKGTMVAEYSTKTASAKPNSIVAGSDGNLWFTESGT